MSEQQVAESAPQVTEILVFGHACTRDKEGRYAHERGPLRIVSYETPMDEPHYRWSTQIQLDGISFCGLGATQEESATSCLRDIGQKLEALARHGTLLGRLVRDSILGAKRR